MASNIEGVYGDTKLMQVLFSAELQRRLRHLPIQSIAVHPGFVATRFGATDRRWLQTLLVVTRPFLARDPQQGALTQVLAATSPNLPRRAGLTWTIVPFNRLHRRRAMRPALHGCGT
jgi:NAD(P)-dependent dehydrogenase (short-subunit alcohol dehydrogenase family)